MQKILSLLITLAILYAVIQLQHEKDSSTVITASINSTNENIPQNHQTVNQTTVDVEGNFLEKTLSKVLINVLKTEDGKMFFENILQPMNKPLAGSGQSFKINNTNFMNSIFKINTYGKGTVGPASCGHIVTIKYQTQSDVLSDEKILTYKLGSRSNILGLDNIIVGMMVGQTRQAVIPSKYLGKETQANENYNISGFLKINVTLQEILPQNFVKDDEVKIYDDEIAYRMPLLCGNRAIFDAKIIKLSNSQVIYDSSINGSKINMTIGQMDYPLIFSHSLFGKIPIGTRTVIAKGKVFQSLSSGISKIFPNEQLPASEYFMLELSNFTENN